MAHNQSDVSGRYRPLSELSNYSIEQGDPDPRGWSVVGTDGYSIGTVVDLLVDTSARKVRQLLVDATGDGSHSSLVMLDIEAVDLRPNTREVLARGYIGQGFDRTSVAQYERTHSGDTGRMTESEDRLTRTEEELRIGKREVSRGEVRIGKHVEVEHVSQPVTRRREEVVVERRPVEAGARTDAATIGDAEVRIPLTEEEVVVEKRPVVKEELVVGKRVVEERDVVETDVRREKFDLDNVDETSRERSKPAKSR